MSDKYSPESKGSPGFFSKMYHSFVKNDIETVHNRVWDEVVVPTIENMIIDGANTALSTLFDKKRNYIQNRPVLLNGSSLPSTVITNSSITNPSMMNNVPRVFIADAKHFNAAEHIFKDRETAEIVLVDLYTNLGQYQRARLSDFYNSSPVGITPEPVAYDYGWYDLTGVKPMKLVGGGWILNLPAPVPLNKN